MEGLHRPMCSNALDGLSTINKISKHIIAISNILVYNFDDTDEEVTKDKI